MNLQKVSDECFILQKKYEKYLFLKDNAIDDFEKIDRELMEKICSFHELTNHNSQTSLDRDDAQPGYFEKIASTPYELFHPEVGYKTDDNGRNLILNPSICYHCFLGVKAGLVDPNKIISSRGICRRYEHTESENIFRLTSFEMREFVVIGSKEEVLAKAESIFHLVSSYISSLVGKIEVKVASDSFMGKNAQAYKRYQRAMELKRELVYQHKCYEIALASINIHYKTMYSAFVKEDDTHSACIAIGLDRLFLAYKINEFNN